MLCLGDTVHCDCHFGRVVQVRELGEPGAIGQEMLFHVPDEILHAVALVIARTPVMDVAKSALDWLFIMHLQSVGSPNEFAAELRESGNRNPKLPVLVTSHTVARVLAGFDGCPQLYLSDVECFDTLAECSSSGLAPSFASVVPRPLVRPVPIRDRCLLSVRYTRAPCAPN